MPPQGSDLVLTTDIPHCKANVLVFDRLNVETFFFRKEMKNKVCYYQITSYTHRL